ncbi:uncharacterized protein LOC106663691 [Cimex lectularius]|uniref:Uncharacterized protein n=1 Tax=Cimex lectularius TaxID=79782 RepID=A0A8I6RDQ8_CIMLE|nr:uncharacterized protein LOC106663691 [Cimex lectularius]
MESSIKPKTKLDHVDQASTCVVYKGKDTDIKKQIYNGTQQLLDLGPSSTKAGVDVIEQFRKDIQDDHLTEVFISKNDKINNSKTNSFCEDRGSNSTDDQKADVSLKRITSKDNQSKTGLDHEDQCSTRTVDQKADNLKVITSKDTQESKSYSDRDDQSYASTSDKKAHQLNRTTSKDRQSEADSDCDDQSSTSEGDKKVDDDLIRTTSRVTKSEADSVHDNQSTSSGDDKKADDDLKGTIRKSTQSDTDSCSTSSALIAISKDSQSSDSSQNDESSSSIENQKADDDLKGSTMETQSKSNEALDVQRSARMVDKKADDLTMENTDLNQDVQGSAGIVDKNSDLTKPASTVKLKIKTVSDYNDQASTSMSQKKADDFINSTIKHSQQRAEKDEVYEINFGLCPYPSPMLSVPINSRGSFKGEKNDSIFAQPVTPINYNNEIPNNVVNQQSNSKNVPNNMCSIEKEQEKHSDGFLERIKKKREFIRHSLFDESDDTKEMMLKVSTSKTTGKKDGIEVIYGQDSTRNEACCGNCGQTHNSIQPSREILKRMMRDHNLNFKIPLVFNMLDHTDSLGEINPDTNCCTFPGKNVKAEELLVYMKLKSEVLKDLRSSFDHAVRNSLNNSSHPGTPNQEQNQNILYIQKEPQNSKNTKRGQDKNT